MEKFLEDLTDLMDTDAELTMDTVLNDIDEWDSLSIVSFLAYARTKLGKTVNSADVKNAEKVEDLYNMVK